MFRTNEIEQTNKQTHKTSKTIIKTKTNKQLHFCRTMVNHIFIYAHEKKCETAKK